MLTKKTINRIKRDVYMLQNVPLVNENIFIIPDDDDLTLVRCLIIGPSDTPYENGIYFYEFRFPDNYPYSPPKVRFLTNDGNTRMHPNFYSCGKVCVSIIGTWNGPGWTSCQSLSSVLLTFLSLFIKNPLWQEPGFAEEKTQRNRDYNKLITYENIRIGVLKMMSNIPSGFEVFRDIMIDHLIMKKDELLEIHKSRLEINGIVSSPQIYGFSKNIDYHKLLEELEKMYDNLETVDYTPFIDNIVANIPIEESIPYKELVKKVSDSSIFLDSEVRIDNVLNILEMRKLIKRSIKGEISIF